MMTLSASIGAIPFTTVVASLRFENAAGRAALKSALAQYRGRCRIMCDCLTEDGLKYRLRSLLIPLGVALAGTAADCSGITEAIDYDSDSTQREEVWAFVTDDPQGGQIQAKVIMKGCTRSSCTSATIESVPPFEWGTPFGTCTMRWHISGHVSGDLVSFTLNGNDCQTTLQGRSVSGGRLNGTFGSATATSGTSTMSWNGFSTLFSSSGQPQPFSGSGYWVAYRCAGARVPCTFPVP
jgi:hypothetical protein